MDTYVGRVLEERFASRNSRSKKTKHVIDLALETYLKENNVNDTSKLDRDNFYILAKLKRHGIPSLGFAVPSWI